MGFERVGELGMLWLYRLIQVPALVWLSFACGVVVAWWGCRRFCSAKRRCEAIGSVRGVTGEQAAREVLAAAVPRRVGVACGEGYFADYFDRQAVVVRLSRAVHDGSTLASVCVAAREVGFALQEVRRDAPYPLAVRDAVAMMTRLGLFTVVLLAGLGLVLDLPAMLAAGLLLYPVLVILGFVNWRLEREGAHRAHRALVMTGLVDADQEAPARQFLEVGGWRVVARMLPFCAG